MRFAIIAEFTGFFEPSEFDYDQDRDLSCVVEKVKAEVNTPEFLDFLMENETEGCSICIVDFYNRETAFITVDRETKIIIKDG